MIAFFMILSFQRGRHAMPRFDLNPIHLRVWISAPPRLYEFLVVHGCIGPVLAQVNRQVCSARLRSENDFGDETIHISGLKVHGWKNLA